MYEYGDDSVKVIAHRAHFARGQFFFFFAGEAE